MNYFNIHVHKWSLYNICLMLIVFKNIDVINKCNKLINMNKTVKNIFCYLPLLNDLYFKVEYIA